MKKKPLLILASGASLYAQTAVQPVIQNYTYAVVISEASYQQNDWKQVADTLAHKHNKISAKVFTYKNSPSDVLDSLSKMMPTYVAWVARPVIESNHTGISQFSKMMRTLDQDPYVDAIWSVVTGYNAADALRAVQDRVEVKTMLWASGGANEDPQGPTPLRYFKQGIGMAPDSYTQTSYSFPDGTKLDDNSGHPENSTDRTPLIAKWLNADSINIQVPGRPGIIGPIDAVQTGGHGFEKGWQAHYNDAGTEGYMLSNNGQLSMYTYDGRSLPIHSPTPKVYMATNNCLVANPDNIDNMVYAWFHTGRAVNMHGFMPLASAGDEFMSWGPYNRYTKFNGKYNLPESYFYAQAGTTFEINHPTRNGFYTMGTHQASDPNVGTFYYGVDYFIDQAVVYGDPKADAYVFSYGDQTHAYTENFTMTPNTKGDSATFTYTVQASNSNLDGNRWFYYQMRPMYFLPQRIDPNSVQLISNQAGTPEITDNFVMWELVAPNTSMLKGEKKTLSFKAKLIPSSPKNTTVNTITTQNIQRQPVQLLHASAEKIEILSSSAYEVNLFNINGERVQTIQSEGSQTLAWKQPLNQGIWFIQIKQDHQIQKWTLRVP